MKMLASLFSYSLNSKFQLTPIWTMKSFCEVVVRLYEEETCRICLLISSCTAKRYKKSPLFFYEYNTLCSYLCWNASKKIRKMGFCLAKRDHVQPSQSNDNEFQFPMLFNMSNLMFKCCVWNDTIPFGLFLWVLVVTVLLVGG